MMREADIFWTCVLMIAVLSLIGFAGATVVVMLIDLMREWAR